MARAKRRERGAVLAFTGIMLIAVFAFAVVAVDIGRLAFTATEVQTVADIAATAGATAAMNGDDAVAHAQSVVALNSVDGDAASIDAGDVILGNYDQMTETFTAGGAPTNAVRANAMATVNNILASILGTASTTVQKTATAAFVTVGGATPELPIAIGSCYFENLCDGCMPSLIQVPSSSTGEANNSGWTSFFSDASAQNIRSFMPQPCGDGVAVPHISVGDDIGVSNGQIANIYDNFQCLLDHNINEFLVPVVQSPNGSCSGPLGGDLEVVGFVTLVVDSVNGMGSPKYVNLHAVTNPTVPGPPGGCTACGSGYVVLVD